MTYDLSTSRPGRLAAATIGILAGLSAFFGAAPVARANLLLTVQSVTAKPGDVNDALDVYLTNSGATPVDVAAFNFEITTSSSDVTFQESTTGTSLFPYIFAGNSFVEAFLGTSVNSTSVPGQTLDASDLTAIPNSFTVVNPDGSFGLGKIFFNVAPGAAVAATPVVFNTSTAFSSLSDQFGNLLPLNFSNGEITISEIPEPSTWALTLLGFAGLGLAGYRRAAGRGARLRPIHCWKFRPMRPRVGTAGALEGNVVRE